MFLAINMPFQTDTSERRPRCLSVRLVSPVPRSPFPVPHHRNNRNRPRQFSHAECPRFNPFNLTLNPLPFLACNLSHCDGNGKWSLVALTFARTLIYYKVDMVERMIAAAFSREGLYTLVFVAFSTLVCVASLRFFVQSLLGSLHGSRCGVIDYVILGLIVLGIAKHGSTKGTNNNDRVEVLVPQPVETSPVLEPLPRETHSESLAFTSIHVVSNGVALSLACPTQYMAGTCIDLFVKVGSLTNRWSWIDGCDVSFGETNLEMLVSLPQLVGLTNAPTAAFFLATDRNAYAMTMSDTDGDGLPDVYELGNGTNPYVPDASLAPAIFVGPSGDFLTIDEAISASSAYSIISLLPGEHVLSGSLVMPDHPVMLTGPEDGYAVLRSDAEIAVVKLTDGQDAETLFRNICLVLDATDGFQAGFWIGGDLPWSGIAASPTFENVRIRAPHSDTLYYGWHYYRDDGKTSVLTNCVMNAAGATSVVGVYSYGGPTIEVNDCHFVNFPATNGNYATYFQQGTNVVAAYAEPEPGLSWAGYPLDAAYSATADSDADGVSDCDEIHVYDTDPWLADSDGDGIPDGVEIADGTDPRDMVSYLRHITVIVSAQDSLPNVTNYVAWGCSSSGWVTNDVTACPNRVATNQFEVSDQSADIYVKAFRDFNRNGNFDEDDDELQSVQVAGRHSFTARLRLSVEDSDGDGMPNWWEIIHADAGLSPTNEADAFIDYDSDGLVNLHEFWTGCDPLSPDGSNTVLSVMARAVDVRLPGTTMRCLYSNYSLNGVQSGLIKDVSNWAYDIDLSCASPWNGWHSNLEAGVLITRRHVLFAKHYLFNQGAGNRVVYFRQRDGGSYSSTVIATNASDRTDIAIAFLSEDAPSTISLASILPLDYADYISTGNGLPMLTLDYQEKTLIHDIVSLPKDPGNVSARYPVNPLRCVHTEPIVVGDSGNPRFLLLDTTPILVSTLWAGPNTPASGPFMSSWRDEIQRLVDELTVAAGLDTNSYRVVECDLSQYPKLPKEGDAL